jgi:hypothetical protein
MLLFSALHDVIFVLFKNPSGFTLNKIFFFISFTCFLILIFQSSFKNRVEGFMKLLLYLFFFWCTVTYFRGIITSIEEDRITNLLNPIISLGVIVPFSLVIGFHPKFSFNHVYKILIFFVKIGIILMPFAFVIERGYLIPRIFLDASFFLLIFLNKIESKKEKYLVLIGCVCYAFLGYHGDNRSILLRISLQLVFLLIYTYGEKFFNKRLVKNLLIIGVILIPAGGFIYYDYLINQSDMSIGNIKTEDTRTFLYVEVINEVSNNDKLVEGKGTLGRYYSDWFYHQMGVDDVVDTYYRSHVEVGILSYLLKGGLILVVLFILLLFLAAKQNLASPNFLVKGLSFIILNHLLVSFIENIPKYFAYDLIFWIIVGYVIRHNFTYILRSNTSLRNKKASMNMQ